MTPELLITLIELPFDLIEPKLRLYQDIESPPSDQCMITRR